MRIRTVRVGKKTLKAFSVKLGAKHLVVIKGAQGYVMCGYLNLQAADMFGDVAVIVSGVSSVTQAVNSVAKAVSKQAYALGIRENQPIRDVLKIIA